MIKKEDLKIFLFYCINSSVVSTNLYNLSDRRNLVSQGIENTAPFSICSTGSISNRNSGTIIWTTPVFGPTIITSSPTFKS